MVNSRNLQAISSMPHQARLKKIPQGDENASTEMTGQLQKAVLTQGMILTQEMKCSKLP